MFVFLSFFFFFWTDCTYLRTRGPQIRTVLGTNKFIQLSNNKLQLSIFRTVPHRKQFNGSKNTIYHIIFRLKTFEKYVVSFIFIEKFQNLVRVWRKIENKQRVLKLFYIHKVFFSIYISNIFFVRFQIEND